MFLCRKIEGK
jgi:NAD-dependent deacetylase